jgi:hypothetical protein
MYNIDKLRPLGETHWCPACRKDVPIELWTRKGRTFVAACKPCRAKKIGEQRAAKADPNRRRSRPHFKNSGMYMGDVFKDMIKLMERDFQCKISVHRYSKNKKKRTYLIRFYDSKWKVDLEKRNNGFFLPYLREVLNDDREQTRKAFFDYLKNYVGNKTLKFFDPVMEQIAISVQSFIDETGGLTIGDIFKIRRSVSRWYEDPETKKGFRCTMTRLKDYLHKENIIPNKWNITPSFQNPVLPRSWKYKFKKEKYFFD